MLTWLVSVAVIGMSGENTEITVDELMNAIERLRIESQLV